MVRKSGPHDDRGYSVESSPVSDRGVVGHIHTLVGGLQDLSGCPDQGGNKKQRKAAQVADHAEAQGKKQAGDGHGKCGFDPLGGIDREGREDNDHDGIKAHDGPEPLWTFVSEHGGQLKRQAEGGLGIDKRQDYMDEHEGCEERPLQQDFQQRSLLRSFRTLIFGEAPDDLFFRRRRLFDEQRDKKYSDRRGKGIAEEDPGQVAVEEKARYHRS
ncbi:hypothetical protein ES708_05145 [subsurface metagenome]